MGRATITPDCSCRSARTARATVSPPPVTPPPDSHGSRRSAGLAGALGGGGTSRLCLARRAACHGQASLEANFLLAAQAHIQAKDR